MKKSEFKEIVKEAMLEILPELMEILAEGLNANLTPIHNTVVQESPNFDYIRDHVKTSVGSKNDYTGVRTISGRGPSLDNDRVILDGGEHFASGQGVMEWFGKQEPVKPKTEFVHTDNQMDDFLSKKFGV